MNLIEELLENIERVNFYNDYELNTYYRLRKIERLYFNSRIGYLEYKKEINKILDERKNKKELFSEYETYIFKILEQIKLINSEIFYSVYQNDFDFNRNKLTSSSQTSPFSEFKIPLNSNFKIDEKKYLEKVNLRKEYLAENDNITNIKNDLNNNLKKGIESGIELSKISIKEDKKTKLSQKLILPFNYFFIFIKHGFYLQMKGIKNLFKKIFKK
ncbi:MAG: hypothetical protein ACOCRX_06685 [Candidatus Woesearchaeota archaeon]